ncbi:TetR/AcrR family transcriptional regulator [Vibrio sp. F74]|uniref:TetR/AcrR family transcriptional regulator n=1 Tax=Vibrio sp. F74 TaxID=700020 RepID=UPI0035F55202
MSPECSDKRKLILNATEKLVAEEGIHGLSMQKLAKEAGVAAGTIYRYFDDKEHLIEETRYHVSQRTADIIQAGVDDDMTLKEKYSIIWLNIWHFANTKDAVKSHMLFEQLSSKEEGCHFPKKKEIFYKIEQMFDEGKSQGIFKLLDNKVLSSVSLESSAALARKHRNNGFPIDDEAITQAIDASWDALINH